MATMNIGWFRRMLSKMGITAATTFVGNLTGNVTGTIGGTTPAAGAFTTLAASGASTLTGAVAAGSTLAVTGASTLTGAVAAGSTLDVTGAATIGGTLAVTGALTQSGAAALGSTLSVAGASTLTGAVTAPAGVTANVTGDLTGGVKCATIEQRFAEVTITAQQLKALRASPKELVAAPGAGKMLELVSMMLILDYGSEVLVDASSYNMAVKYANGSGLACTGAIEATGLIDANADAVLQVAPSVPTVQAKTAQTNAALVLHNTGAGEYTGNASNDTVMRAKITYRVHTTGL